MREWKQRLKVMIEQEERLPRMAGALCLAICLSFAIAGFWPFGHPRNDLSWIPNRSGVVYGEHSTILSKGPLAPGRQGSCSVEMLLKPLKNDDSGTLLSFHNSKRVSGLSLHQSLTDLRLDDHSGRAGPSRFYVNNFFEEGKPVFLTVVAGHQGTAIFRDGKLARRIPRFVPDAGSCTGDFVVGDSASDHNSWSGEIAGLAIYGEELTDDQARRNYLAWGGGGRPTGSSGESPKALYLFDERRGNLVRDHGAARVDLWIPDQYLIAAQTLLGSPLGAIESKWGYLLDAAINVGGFIPFGFSLGAYLSSKRRIKSAGLATVLIGSLTSLTIEVTQAWIPTRNSDLTDVITNTLGTCVGFLLFRNVVRGYLARHRAGRNL